MNIQNRQKLSEIIKTARGTMSQRAFGKLLGVSATAVQLWERGDTVPDTENLGKLAARAGYTLEEFLSFLTAIQSRNHQKLTILSKKFSFCL